MTSETDKRLEKTASTILDRIEKQAAAETDYRFEQEWEEILVCVKESMDSYASLHAVYRLCNYGFLDSNNPWYMARDILGEELVRAPGQPLPGTLDDPTFGLKA